MFCTYLSPSPCPTMLCSRSSIFTAWSGCRSSLWSSAGILARTSHASFLSRQALSMERIWALIESRGPYLRWPVSLKGPTRYWPMGMVFSNRSTSPNPRERTKGAATCTTSCWGCEQVYFYKEVGSSCWKPAPSPSSASSRRYPWPIVYGWHRLSIERRGPWGGRNLLVSRSPSWSRPRRWDLRRNLT